MESYLLEAFSRAFSLAEESVSSGEIPVGAVILREKKELVGMNNAVTANRDPTSHAEILAIRKATDLLGNERLVNCELVTTLEPCVMCSGAIILSRIFKVHCLAQDNKLPALRKVIDLSGHNHRPKVEFYDLPEYPSANLLKSFFQSRR